MPSNLTTLDGSRLALGDEDLAAFASTLHGELVDSTDPDYDEVRAIWNAMIDKRPGLIVRCRDAEDVVTAVNFVRERNLLSSVRGAGHNIAGSALCEAGVVIDLSLMRSVQVDPKLRRVRSEPGATLADLDRETQAHGLAVPVGINSTTGVSGLTLGGGFGWISRKYGLTIDNLVSADVVLASGERVRAGKDANQDLFWGIRGGGGNFGIVTSFEYQAHPVGPQVLSGLIVHAQADAPRLLRRYRDLAAQAPDELTVWIVLRKAPPLPFLPAEVHGTDVVVFAAMYTGDVKDGEKAIAPFQALGSPVGQVMVPQAFTGWQAAFDPLLTPGMRNYWKSHNFNELSDQTIDTVLKYASNLPSAHSEIFIAQMGGATARVPVDATPYEGREAKFVMNVHTRWDTAAEDAACIGWARDFFEATRPMATGGVYVNFMPADEDDRITGAYGVNYTRLVEVKKKYDPKNLFRTNRNIAPE